MCLSTVLLAAGTRINAVNKFEQPAVRPFSRPALYSSDDCEDIERIAFNSVLIQRILESSSSFLIMINLGMGLILSKYKYAITYYLDDNN